MCYPVWIIFQPQCNGRSSEVEPGSNTVDSVFTLESLLSDLGLVCYTDTLHSLGITSPDQLSRTSEKKLISFGITDGKHLAKLLGAGEAIRAHDGIPETNLSDTEESSGSGKEGSKSGYGKSLMMDRV